MSHREYTQECILKVLKLANRVQTQLITVDGQIQLNCSQVKDWWVMYTHLCNRQTLCLHDSDNLHFYVQRNRKQGFNARYIFSNTKSLSFKTVIKYTVCRMFSLRTAPTAKKNNKKTTSHDPHRVYVNDKVTFSVLKWPRDKRYIFTVCNFILIK